MTWLATALLLATLNAQSVPPPAESPASMLAKQAELIESQDEMIVLLEQKVAALEAAITFRKQAELAQGAEIDACVRVTETYKKLYLAETEFSTAERKRAAWTERMVALKWGLIGGAVGVLATEVAK